ncbi:MAG: phosphomannomutase [Candidatus Methanoplasma sp.]|jgi:phosphoglucosamine mutase|nr:phosphomannomutase [Candidatus Methanoplasma sp.]
MTESPSLTIRSLTNGNMTADKALRIGQILGLSHRSVCVGTDTNPSSGMIKNSFISGLLSVGADVNDAGIMPAPAVALASGNSDCMAMVGEPDEYGAVSRISVMNSDGSVFTKEQLRQLIVDGERDVPLPKYKEVGTIRPCDSVAEDYRRTMCAKYRVKNTPLILDCGCGSTSVCAPQIMASIGADLTAVNAQFDPLYCPRPPGVGIDDVSGLSDIIDPELGSIGIALNGDGTRLALFDEDGRYVAPESILALILLYLKPSSAVIPLHASALVDDAFRDLIGERVSSAAESHPGRQIIRADDDLESITAAMKKNNADMGAMTDGTFIFSDVSMCPDAINAAAILTKMSEDNCIRDLLASFPRYIVLKESVQCPGRVELFDRKLNENLNEIPKDDVWEIEGGRVGMAGGWFAVSKNTDSPEQIDITAEAKDRAYAVSMMEFAKDIVRSCS